MALDIKIPSLGDGITGGDVVTLLVKPGESVKEGQGLVEIETGKATVEIPSPADGVLKSLSVKVGEKKSIGDVIGILETGGAPTTLAPVAVAKLEESKGTEVTLVTAKPAPVLQTPNSELPASIPSQTLQTPNSVPQTPIPTSRPAHAPIPAAPSVRKFAREIGIDVRAVPGSGPAGRISVEDVKAFSRALNQGGRAAPASGGGMAPKPLPDFSKFGEVAVEKMNTIRRMTVQHMAYCWATVPHVTQHDEADVGPLEKLRAKYNKVAEPKGVKLTVTALLLKVLADLMKAFPKFNASIDVTKDEIVFKKFVNIGVAVDTPKGLLVPVLRNVDTKSLLQVGGDLKTYADKVKSGKISPDDLAGGGITLTNIGGLGGKHFTPIVNSPEVAILGVGRAEYKPVWDTDAGAFVPKLMMPLSLSYDHRLIDGADGTRFLRALVETIEMPMIALE